MGCDNGYEPNYQNKIDNKAVNGLAGVSNSLAYKVHEIENHLHSRERWFGISGDQSGNDWALAAGLTPFVAISGAADYGGDASDEAKIFGTDDTPVIAGSAYFDVHRMLILDVDHTTPYVMRLVWGTGTMAAAITALQFTEFAVMSDATNPQLAGAIPVEIMMPRIAVDTQVWMQAKNATDDSEIDFLIGMHEYSG